jgi:glutamate-1-semialdehyde 2,1-aminomutase
VLPAGKVFQAGTLSGNPVATAAGIATLQRLANDPPYEHLERVSSRLEAGLRQAAAAVPHCVNRVGSMLTLFFHPGPVEHWDHANQSDTQRYGEFFWNMIRHGVYLPCSQFEALFVSAAHTDEDIQQTIDAAVDSIARL